MRQNRPVRSSVSRTSRTRLRYGWGYEKSDFGFYGGSGQFDRELTNYLGYRWFRYKVRPVLNSKWARSVTEDKWIFYRIVDSLGLPAPRTFGLYDRTYGSTWDLARPLRRLPDLVAELERLRPPGVVIKPNGGRQGERVLVLDSIDYDSGRAATRTGEATTLEQALGGVDVDARVGGYPGYIVQELVRNHGQLEELAPYATNTLRVQTLLTTDGQVHVLGAVLRLSRRGKMVDNFSQGGIALAIDQRTGRTGGGIDKENVPFNSRHPDSGSGLVGKQVPFWDDVLDVVRRGAGCLTGLRAVAWDIAVTPSGPVIIEANGDWNLQILQVHTDGFLADPDFRGWMADIGAPLPSGNVVQGFVGRWLWPVYARVRK